MGSNHAKIRYASGHGFIPGVKEILICGYVFNQYSIAFKL